MSLIEHLCLSQTVVYRWCIGRAYARVVHDGVGIVGLPEASHVLVAERVEVGVVAAANVLVHNAHVLVAVRPAGSTAQVLYMKRLNIALCFWRAHTLKARQSTARRVPAVLVVKADHMAQLVHNRMQRTARTDRELLRAALSAHFRATAALNNCTFFLHK